MSRLFNLSNRVVVPEPGSNVAGGLDNTLLSCNGFDTIVRLGFSGNLVYGDYDFENPEKHIKTVSREREDGRSIVYHLLDLPANHYKAFYESISNGDLWNLQHFRPDLVSGSNECRQLYTETCKIYAKAVNALIEDSDEQANHDYHFMHYAKVAREMGVNRPLNLIMHIPMPDEGVFHDPRLKADSRDFMHKIFSEDLFAYDMISLQAPRDLQRWETVLGVSDAAAINPYETKKIWNKSGESLIVGVFPATGDSVENKKKLNRMLETRAADKFFEMATDGRIVDGVKPEHLKLIVGADRIDPSKALPKRLHALKQLFEAAHLDPHQVSIIQAAAQSRENVPGYREEIEAYRKAYNHLRDELDVNIHSPNDGGKFLPLDQGSIFVGYHMADVGLFVSDIDGMHLGPKEFTDVADPKKPGACVITNSIGAAQEFKNCAVVVEPTVEGIAKGIQEGLAMPVEKRIEQNEERARIMAENNNERWINGIINATRKLEPTFH